MLDFDNRELFDEKGSDLTKHNNDEIDSHNANINIIVGERANGKSYPTLAFNGVKEFIDSDYKTQFSYIRRYDDEITLNGPDLFKGMIHNGWLEWYSHGKWNDIQYYRHMWFLRRIGENGEIAEKCSTPMSYAFAINMADKLKGPDRPGIKTIIFDEFIPDRGSGGYVTKEIHNWNSIISSIDRGRNQCKIYMICNTISKNCPYFDYYHIDPDKLIQGKINVAKIGTSGKLAIEYCATTGDVHTKDSVYFSLDDEIGNMILTGGWETPTFPKLPNSYLTHLDELTTFKFYFLLKNSKLVEGRFLATEEMSTIYFRMHYGLLEPDDLVYTEEWFADAINLPNVRVGLRGNSSIDRTILSKILSYRCYYESDDVGDKVQHFTTI